jgi:hypothetical protein
MFEPIGPTRKLPYPLYNQVSNENTTEAFTDRPPFVFPSDPEERTLVPLWVSQREFTAIASAMDVGADIAYPLQYVEVMYILLRNLRYPPMICSLIIECLNNDADTQQAIADLIASNPAIQSAIRDFVVGDPAIKQNITDIASDLVLSLENRLQNLLKPEQCDPDYLFNQSSVLVQLLHDVTEDIFEAIEVGTNALERGQILLSAIPISGQLVPADEALELADQLAEEIQEDYMGAYDEALYDQIRCGLFCTFKDTCDLSLDQAITFYNGLLADEIPDDPVEAFKVLLGFLIAGDFPTDAPVYAMHMFVLVCIRLSQNVLGIDFGQLALRVLAAGDDPDNDWTVLCDECGATPNIRFTGTLYPNYDGTPKTFLGNTETGGSIWEITCQNISGVSAAALTMKQSDGVSDTCVYIVASEGVTSYQHNLCGSVTQESGAGAGNPTTPYGPNVGFFGTGIITVTFEPADV